MNGVQFKRYGSIMVLESSNKKADKYIAALNQALENTQFKEIPELSRKVRKHSPASITLARGAEVQALLLQRLEQNQKAIDELNLNDEKGVYHWLSLDPQDVTQGKGFIEKATSTKSDRHQDLYEAVNVFYEVASRQLSTVLNMNWQSISHRHSQFTLQTLALIGIGFDLSGLRNDAIQIYVAATHNQSWSATPPTSVWRDHILYRLAILDSSQVNYDRYLQHSKGGASSATRLLHVLSTRSDSGAYQSQLFRITNFPAADRTNLKLLDHVTHLMNPWFAGGRDPLQAEKQLDMLFEVASKTFHSPRILRYVFHVLTSLERYDEAVLAAEAYLQIAVHAYEAQTNMDADSMLDIVDTVYHVISQTLAYMPSSALPHRTAKRLSQAIIRIAVNDTVGSLILATVHAIQAKSLMLEFQATGNTEKIESAIALFKQTLALAPSPGHWLDLSLALAQYGDVAKAMAAIQEALQLDCKHQASLQCSANLLCCEELYERAEIVLQQVNKATIRKTFREKRQLFDILVMQVKISEQLHGPAYALKDISALFFAFTELFGTPTPTRGSAPAATTHVSSTPPHIPSLHVHDESTLDANDRSDSRQSCAVRLAPDRNFSDLPEIRSASLKLTHPHLQLPNENLRKSVSMRSLQLRRAENIQSGSIPASSRSSSPLNVPSMSTSTSVIDLTDLPIDIIRPDHQATAIELQAKHCSQILADLWLYVAQLITSTETSHIDAEAALNEARAILGSTAQIIMASTQIFLTYNKRLTEVQIANIHSSFETVSSSGLLPSIDYFIGFSTFLLQQNEISRAYELIERSKISGVGQRSAQIWSLSAKIARTRGEVDRAEQEEWRSIDCADSTGVIPWILVGK